MPSALIVFSQNSVVGTAGRAHVGNAGQEVTVSNNDNTDVLSWSIDLLYTPPGSSTVVVPNIPVIIATADSATPLATFTADLPGSYRCRITVYDQTGLAGNSDVDIRNFIVLTPKRSIVIPPYQEFPEPLPILGSGESGEKPEELNYDGQLFGWAGDESPSKKGLHQVLSIIDDFTEVPNFSSVSQDQSLQVNEFDYHEPNFVVSTGSPDSIYVLNSNFSTTADTGILPSLMPVDSVNDITLSDTVSGLSNELLGYAATDGVRIWLLSADGATFSALIREVTTTGRNPVVGSSNVLSVGAAFAGITYGDGFIWASDQASIIRVNPATLSGPYSTIASGGAISDIEIDTDTANYGDVTSRVWITDTALPGLRRLETSTPALDDSVTLVGETPVGVGVGGGYIWTVGIGTGTATTYRIDPDPAAISTSSTSIDATFSGGALYDVYYLSTTNQVFVYGETSGGDPTLVRVDPTTLAVNGSVTLDTSITVGSGGPPPRISFHNGTIWVTATGGSTNPRVWRINPTTLAEVLISSPRSIAWQDQSVKYDVSADITTSASVTPAGKSPQIIRILPGDGAWPAAPGGTIIVAPDLPVGYILVIADVDGAAGSKPITIDGGVDTINGVTNWTISNNWGSAVMVKTAVGEWSIINAKEHHNESSLVAGIETATTTGFVTIGATSIDPDVPPRPNVSQIEFKAIIQTDNAADSAEIELYNVTTASSVNTASTASTNPVEVSFTFTPTAGLNIYEARLRLVTTGAPNTATCKQARVVFDWVQV